jgi:ankyrin repeat protein
MPQMPEDPAILFFETAWTAMVEGDLARLEELTHLNLFPRGTDGWLDRHWLTSAIFSSNPVSVAWVLSNGPEVNYVDDEGFTALMSALQVEHSCQMKHLDQPKSAEEATALTIQLIDLLLAAGAEINLGATMGETALHFAALRSSPAVIRHLLACGANPRVYDSDYTPCCPADNAKLAKRWEVAAILREAMESRN